MDKSDKQVYLRGNEIYDQQNKRLGWFSDKDPQTFTASSHLSGSSGSGNPRSTDSPSSNR